MTTNETNENPRPEDALDKELKQMFLYDEAALEKLQEQHNYRHESIHATILRIAATSGIAPTSVVRYAYHAGQMHGLEWWKTIYLLNTFYNDKRIDDREAKEREKALDRMRTQVNVCAICGIAKYRCTYMMLAGHTTESIVCPKCQEDVEIPTLLDAATRIVDALQTFMLFFPGIEGEIVTTMQDVQTQINQNPEHGVHKPLMAFLPLVEELIENYPAVQTQDLRQALARAKRVPEEGVSHDA